MRIKDGGFHKRKVQRQKKAKEEFLKQLKEEKKRIKQDARERYKKLLSNRDVPELEKLLSEREFETETHTVSILEMDIESLYEKNKYIGINKAVDNKEEEFEKEEEEEEDEESEEKSTAKTSVRGVKGKNIESAKDLKKAIKYAALKEVKKSKVFQQKNRLEHNKNKKLNIRKKKKQEKRLKRCDGKLKRKGKR
ncbi:PREDICTED: nucleolar protein 12 isoform X2 [Polistes dominula]|uniref:Nucleolar protein 12 isoform X2 n=1 Tax=Polistes dominula TaxID=743375 RepID=A0ABM1IWY9_POLDO|nr:PREDICTED: nucleolar protein 12 isoform X2 [Polistes dominula]